MYFAPVVLAQQVGSSASVIHFYIPPDVFYDTGRQIKLEKLDINTASLEQLMALPEINEDLALKIMTKRPVKSLEELVRLPYVNMDRMKIILNGITGYVVQPYEQTEPGLKQ